MLLVSASILATAAIASEAGAVFAAHLSQGRVDPIDGGVSVGGYGSFETVQNATGAVTDAFGANLVLTVNTADTGAHAPVAAPDFVAAEEEEEEAAEADAAPVVASDLGNATSAFVVRLTGADRRALVERGQALSRALAGRVLFDKSGWDGDAWCVRGHVSDLVIVKGVCRDLGIPLAAVAHA